MSDEKVVDLKQVKKDPEPMGFYEALSGAMSEIPMFEKKNKVSFGAGKTKYAYIKLEEINAVVKPILKKYGLFFTHKVENGFLVTTLVHVHSKDGIKSAFKITSNDPQKIGSEITYGKRYNECAILNIDCAGEDDDCVSFYNNRNNPPEDDRLAKIRTWVGKKNKEEKLSFKQHLKDRYSVDLLTELEDEQIDELITMIK